MMWYEGDIEEIWRKREGDEEKRGENGEEKAVVALGSVDGLGAVFIYFFDLY